MGLVIDINTLLLETQVQEKIQIQFRIIYNQIHHYRTAYKLLQQRVGPKYVKISAKDAYMLTKRFGVNRLKPGRPKGLKKSGIAIEIKPNGQYYLLKTKKEQPQEPTEIQNNGN